MSLKRFVTLSILSVSTLVAYASATNDTIARADTIWFDDGAWYLGQIADSLFNGYGKMVYADSTVYQGEWKDGMWDGKGDLYYPDGDSYSGEFSKHQFSGYGEYSYSDGSRYEGYWQNNRFNGSGTMNYADGSIYAGEWKDDRKHGLGVYYDAGTGALQKGEFMDDLFILPPSIQTSAFDNNNDFGWNQSDKSGKRSKSSWHDTDDATIFMSYGINHILSLHADFHTSERFFAGFSLGINTVNKRIGKESVTYDDETSEKIILIDWNDFPDEILTENTCNFFKLTGQCGVSLGWFSIGGAVGIGLKNTIRNCRSLEHNDSYYEPGTLYYREKMTGVRFAYDLFTDFVISRSIPYLYSCSFRAGYGNIDGFFIGAGVTF